MISISINFVNIIMWSIPNYYLYILEHFQVLGDKKKSHRASNNNAMSQMQIAESTKVQKSNQ